MNHIGFTGTRETLTHAQQAALEKVLGELARGEECVLHHGDCVGADAAAHDIAHWLGMEIVVHLPDDDSNRAFRLVPSKNTRPFKPYLERNRDIVDESSTLVACPKGPEEQRSGTWSTVRYARRQGKSIAIVWPDGRVTREGEVTP